jgi:2-polyprenyl-3-methyl-5-hydroxy-6-metoxy-1,4-benzoquinol methylase
MDIGHWTVCLTESDRLSGDYDAHIAIEHLRHVATAESIVANATKHLATRLHGVETPR